MLNQETKTKLEGFGFDVSKLEDAVKSDKEESLDVPNLKTEEEFKGMFSEEDKDAFGKNRFEEGKRAMSEIKAKEFKEKFGVEVDGKDLDKVVEAYADKKAKEASNGNAEWLEEKKKLQKNLQEAEEKLSKKEAEFDQKLFNIESRNEIAAMLPDDTTIPKSDLVDLFSIRYRVAKEDGRTVIYKGAEKLKDKKLDPLPLKDVLNSFLDEGKYLKSNGMGGEDSKSGGGSTDKFKSLKEFQEWCKTQDGDLKNPMSEPAQKILREKKDPEVPIEEFYKDE